MDMKWVWNIISQDDVNEINWETRNAAKGGRDSVVGVATRYGLDGLRIESHFFVPPKPAPRPTNPAGQWVPGLSGSLVLTSHLLLVPSCRWLGATPPPPLLAFIGMSRSDLYLTRKSYLRDVLGTWRKTSTLFAWFKCPSSFVTARFFTLHLGI
jgi:hypothetical protein